MWIWHDCLNRNSTHYSFTSWCHIGSLRLITYYWIILAWCPLHIPNIALYKSKTELQQLNWFIVWLIFSSKKPCKCIYHIYVSLQKVQPAKQAGLLLAPAESFGLQPRLFMVFLPILHLHLHLSHLCLAPEGTAC